MYLIEAERVQGELVDAIQEVHPDAEAGDTVELWMTDDERFCPEGRDWYASREAFLAACGRLPCSAPVVLARVGTAGLLGPLPRWAVEVTAYKDDNHYFDRPILTRYEVEVPHSPLRRATGGYYGAIYSEERLSELTTAPAWSGTVPQEERDRQEADRAALVADLRRAWRDDPDHPWAWVREGEIEHLDPTDDDLEQWRIEAGAGGDQETVAAITAWLDGDRSLDVAIIVADTVRQVEAWQDERAAEQGRART
jgi:hypothetical protein